MDAGFAENSANLEAGFAQATAKLADAEERIKDWATKRFTEKLGQGIVCGDPSATMACRAPPSCYLCS